MCGASTLARASASDAGPHRARADGARPPDRAPPEPVAGDDAAAAAGDQAAADVEPRARRLSRGRGREEPAARARAARRGLRRRRRLPAGDPARRRRRQLSRHAWPPRSTLYDHLREQIGAMRAPPDAVEAALHPRRRAGGRRLPPGAAGRGRGAASACGRRWRSAGLALVQACDPAGVGARSLARMPGAAAARARPARPGDAGAARQPRPRRPRPAGRAEALCGVDAEDIADMLAELRALDPKPGLRFAAAAGAGGGAGRLRAAGAGRRAGRWSSTPRRCRGCSSTTSMRGGSARRRGDAGLRLGMQRQRELAGAQPRAAGAHHPQGRDRDRRSVRSASSASGVAELRPLTQRAVASGSGCTNRPSAGSRPASTSSCDQGASSSASSSARRSRRWRAARPSPRRRCRSGFASWCRRNGRATPLSDDKIVALLNEAGIDIARRTVAKYREGMGIPSSVERRRQKTSLSGTLRGPRSVRSAHAIDNENPSRPYASADSGA